MHRFPKDEELKKKWIQATKWKNWKPSLCSVLCSVHFQEDDLDRSSPFRVYLKKGAVPTIFPAFPKHLQTKTLLKVSAYTNVHKLFSHVPKYETCSEMIYNTITV